MFELTMTASSRDELPTVLLQQSYHLADFHVEAAYIR